MDVKTLEVYSLIEEGKYRGISKKFFPKWEGWTFNGEEKDIAVNKFYMTYFYYPLKLDYIGNDVLEKLVLNFATLQGKKKAISKLQKACGQDMTGHPTAALMTYAGENLEEVLYKYILEIIEFYDFISKPKDSLWALNTFRHL